VAASEAAREAAAAASAEKSRLLGELAGAREALLAAARLPAAAQLPAAASPPAAAAAAEAAAAQHDEDVALLAAQLKVLVFLPNDGSSWVLQKGRLFPCTPLDSLRLQWPVSEATGVCQCLLARHS
jgi:hypothetical protein